MKRVILLFLIGIAGLGMVSLPNLNPDEQMLSMLENAKQTFNNPRNGYSPYARLSLIDSVIRTASPFDRQYLIESQYERSNLLLQLGRPAEAVDQLNQLLRQQDRMPAGIVEGIRLNLALSYLRMGEQTNCIANHSSQMCLFPIRDGGVHKDKTGSREAIRIYEEHLTRFPKNLEARWLLNIAYMTLGEYPASVPKDFLIPDLGAKDGSTLKPFEDIAMQMGMATKDQAGGVILEDFDNDGRLDIIKSSWDISEPMHYFHSNGDGTFSDMSARSGLSRFTGGLNIMQTDYNNDGYRDIFVTRGGWLSGKFGEQPNSLLRNNGDNTFTDVTDRSGLLSFHPTQTATWNDFNNDGWLDVFIGNEHNSSSENDHACELYLNNRDGTFTNVAQQAGCDLRNFVKGVNSGDFDRDGFKDIFLSTMDGKRILLRNKGLKDNPAGKQIAFEDVTHAAGLDDEHHNSFATWFWDYDNDGYLDILACDYTFNRTLASYAAAENLGNPEKFTGQPCLYRNNGNGTFTDVTNAVGLYKTAFAMGSNFGDIDNDGYLDMYLGTGNPNYQSLVPNKMFKNMGGEKFADVTSSANVGSLQKGHAVAFADMDQDGDQDIFIEMGGAYTGDAYQNSFFRNPGQNDNHWISLRLEGVKSNRAAIGSSVKVTFTEKGKTRSVYRDVNSGGSFGASPLTREIGLGQAPVIDQLEIRWHGSGLVQTFRNVPVDRFVTLREGDKSLVLSKPRKVDLTKNAHHAMTVCK